MCASLRNKKGRSNAKINFFAVSVRITSAALFNELSASFSVCYDDKNMWNAHYVTYRLERNAMSIWNLNPI